ncbi:4F2 cell-surface antigen heavy chain-like [Plectropomus leopardus]|uniref:4F2 cell-surface antigen heavy chain-like n=1 Tax=Plectropomus leopardus TaxID=160734 RepID=UPI001C4BC5E7|nr:4F2 cell-surface antigen heavy chain-like [Plectropomus leopardus]
MNTEETNVDVKDAEQEEEAADPAPDAAPVPSDADATEADVSEVDLDQEEQERQPMTGGAERAEDAPSAGGDTPAAEKNGSVKLKIPEEEDREEVKFTGLNKEELLRVAGTPG